MLFKVVQIIYTREQAECKREWVVSGICWKVREHSGRGRMATSATLEGETE